MKKNILAVCDTENGYACRFAEYVNRKKGLPFEAEAFTDTEKLKIYTEEHALEILMVAEADLDPSIEKLPAKKLLLLSEERKKEQGKYRSIYKYQSVEGIVKEVMESCDQTKAFPSMCDGRKEDLKILGVYSPIGRCGKTLFALTAGQILAQEQEVLYISLEDYAGIEGFLVRHGEIDLGDLIYAMRNKKVNPLWKLESATEKLGNLSCLVPMQTPEDVRNVKFHEWAKLLRLIRENKRYQTVILDVGNGADQLFQMLDLCQKVYMPVLKDCISAAKIRRFETLRKRWNPGGEETRIRKLELPALPETETDSFPGSLLWGKWGNYVGKVLKEDETVREEQESFSGDP